MLDKWDSHVVRLKEQISELREQIAELKSTLKLIGTDVASQRELLAQLTHKMRSSLEKSGVAEPANELQSVLSVLDNPDVGAIVVGSDGRNLLFNDIAQDLVGFAASKNFKPSPADLKGIYLADKVTRCKFEDYPWQQCAHGKATQEVVLFVKFDDDSDGIWLRTVSMPILGGENQSKGAVAFLLDTTEQTIVEEQVKQLLATLEQQLSAIETAQNLLIQLTTKLSDPKILDRLKKFTSYAEASTSGNRPALESTASTTSSSLPALGNGNQATPSVPSPAQNVAAKPAAGPVPDETQNRAGGSTPQSQALSPVISPVQPAAATAAFVATSGNNAPGGNASSASTGTTAASNTSPTPGATPASNASPANRGTTSGSNISPISAGTTAVGSASPATTGSSPSPMVGQSPQAASPAAAPKTAVPPAGAPSPVDTRTAASLPAPFAVPTSFAPPNSVGGQTASQVSPTARLLSDALTKTAFETKTTSGQFVQHESRHEQAKKVLIVDDIAVNQKLLRLQLRRLGCEIDVASNGKEAVESVEKKAYDIIFMDLDMPIMDGPTATSKIRAIEAGTGKHVPIVAVTSYKREVDRERCMNAGMDDYLIKGCSQAQLMDVISKFARQVIGAGLERDELIKPILPIQPLNDDVVNLRSLQGKEEMQEVTRLFSSSVKTFVDCLELAVAEKKVEAIGHFCHCIEGPAAAMGLKRLSVIVTEMMIASEEGNWGRVSFCYERLKQHFGQLLMSLSETSPAFQGT